MAKSFKDEEYYISSVPTNMHLEAGLSVKGEGGFESNRLEAAVLDLVADDRAGRNKSLYIIGIRSKKYIKLNNGERVTASGKIKTESGSKVKASKTRMYKKWKERSHIKIPLNGTSTEDTAEAAFAGRQQMRGNRDFKAGNKRWSVPNANVRSELRDPEQIRKHRQQKASKIVHMKSKSGKGKIFGNKRKGGYRGKSADS